MGPLAHIFCLLSILSVFMLPTELPQSLFPSPAPTTSAPEPTPSVTSIIENPTTNSSEPVTLPPSNSVTDMSVSATLAKLSSDALDQIKNTIEPFFQTIQNKIDGTKAAIDALPQ